MADIQVDTPLGKTVHEIWASCMDLTVPMDAHIRQSIIALCNALETYEANLRALAEESAKDIREAREKIERLQKALRLVDEDVRGGGTARVTMGSDPNEFLTYAIKGSTIDVVRECLRFGGEEEK